MLLVYPMCLFCRLRTNMLSTAPSRSCFNTLSVESCCWCSLVALENWRRMSDITGPVLPAGTAGSRPGLAGGTNDTRLRVLKTASVTVMYSNSSVPSPRWDCTEAALALSCRCNSVMVSYLD